MGRSQLLVIILGLGLVAGAAGAVPASGGTIKPASHATFFAGEPLRPERQSAPETSRLGDQSLFIDGVETSRPQLQQVLDAGRQDGLTELEAIDWWLATRGGPAPHLDNLDDAQIEDLRAFAEQSGQSFSSVVSRSGDQEEYQTASWQMEEVFPESYAGMRYRDHGATTTWIGFNGTLPPVALAMIRELPGDVIVEVGDLLPKAKWEQTVNAATRAVSGDGWPSGAGFDIRHQQLVVAVPASRPISDDSIIAAVRDAVPDVAVAVQRPLSFGDTTDSALTTDSADATPIRLWGDHGLDVWTIP